MTEEIYVILLALNLFPKVKLSVVLKYIYVCIRSNVDTKYNLVELILISSYFSE